MPNPKCSDDDFIRMFEEYGGAETSRRLNIAVSHIHERRRRIERRSGRQISGPTHVNKGGDGRDILLAETSEYPGRVALTVRDGYVIVGGDAHYWPGVITTAHRALVAFCKRLKPVVVIMNGDMVDGATISRHPPIGWEKRPALIEEIETVKDRLGEITIAAEKARRIWGLGNHDARYETRLATVAPEYAKIQGVHLKDHFPDWEPCWSVWINDEVVVKHRYRGGIHATHNNTVMSGKTIVTNHLHSQKVTPFDDYNGTRWGVDTGTLAEPYGPQFEYMEDNPRSWRSGFAVLRFCDGELITPQTVRVIGENRVDYCNEVIDV